MTTAGISKAGISKAGVSKAGPGPLGVSAYRGGGSGWLCTGASEVGPG